MNFPICLEKYNDPLIVDCGHSFCRACLEAWMREREMIETDHECPLCKQNIYLPTKNYALEQTLQEHEQVMNEIEPLMKSNDSLRAQVRMRERQLERLHRMFVQAIEDNNRLMKRNDAIFKTSIELNMLVRKLERCIRSQKEILDRVVVRLPIRPAAEAPDVIEID